jgi:hypothetical protein
LSLIIFNPFLPFSLLVSFVLFSILPASPIVTDQNAFCLRTGRAPPNRSTTCCTSKASKIRFLVVDVYYTRQRERNEM